jgi:hypothetical protein
MHNDERPPSAAAAAISQSSGKAGTQAIDGPAEWMVVAQETSLKHRCREYVERNGSATNLIVH